MDLNQMIGKTYTSVKGRPGDDELVFTATDGAVFTFYHHQSCCESVSINEIVGDLDDLVGTSLLTATESSSQGAEDTHSTSTWTFYDFRTMKGTVTVRWFGRSNGYYSERVDLMVNGERQW